MTGISQVEQYSVCAGYVEAESMKLAENFLDFVPVYNVIDCALAHTLMGYDGAASMSGEFRGVQAHVKDKVP
ncbi:hypothetical protein PR048_000998 [Dryococelus australis]|uniref:Uncharacterized protein n=1 Tax=Dryococelus australis TaxID=614101 RepID=A0ABQ9IG82_9NEOP|nr:hypothetical protein PR048_000998 [Dryococelus australis]